MRYLVIPVARVGWIPDVGAGDHPLELAGALEDREDPGLQGSFHRSAACTTPWYQLVSWALEARIIRRQGTRLLPVAKARPLLANAEALRQRAFEAAFAIGAAACPPIWADEPPSPVQRLYDVIVPDALA